MYITFGLVIHFRSIITRGINLLTNDKRNIRLQGLTEDMGGEIVDNRRQL